MQEIKRSISFVGAGNVATHLALAFHEAGFPIGGIYSRTTARATVLADKVDSQVCNSMAEVLQTAHMVIIAVPDHALSTLIDTPVPDDLIIVHTSGALEMNVFSGKAAHYGVLYPLQTFTQKIAVILKHVPFCIEASDKDSLNMLKEVAAAISDTVVEIDSERRKVLHLAAVFACNFPNALYAMADDILRTADLPFRLLHPLILETARKAMLDQPWNVQTGPARRNDLTTIQTHESILESMVSYKEIYRMLSNTIQLHFRSKKE
jgi:predicted short-subunit dehydrogenase-like oxidoreductase (DUF2520 family)